MQGPGESISNKIIAPLIVVVLGAALVGGSPWWWKVIFPDPSPTSSPAPTVTPSTGPTPTTTDASATPTPPPTVAPKEGCILTITYSFASIREKPSHGSTVVGDVPPGDYQASDSRVVNWGGLDQRWFEITASGRTGWIVYDNIMIESKSSECP